MLKKYSSNERNWHIPSGVWLNQEISATVQFSRSVVSHEPQRTRPPCPSPTPRAYPNSCSLIQFMSIESTMPSNNLIFGHPLLLLSIFPSIKVFSNESALCIMGPKYWSFSFNIRSSNEHTGLISFRMDWLDLLAVQGAHQESSPIPQFKSIILQHSAFFIV